MHLSITHMFVQAEARMNIGQSGHAAPQYHVAGWQVAGPVQVATEFGQPDPKESHGSP